MSKSSKKQNSKINFNWDRAKRYMQDALHDTKKTAYVLYDTAYSIIQKLYRDHK